MPEKGGPSQYVLLPPRGLRIEDSLQTRDIHRSFISLSQGPKSKLFKEFSTQVFGVSAPKNSVRVLDSIHENGAKLVELMDNSILNIRRQFPALRIVPVVYYKPAVRAMPSVVSKPLAAGTRAGLRLKIRIISNKDGKPISGAYVIIFTDYKERLGFSGTSGASGSVSFNCGKIPERIERCYVYHKKAYWPFLKKNVPFVSPMEIPLQPIDLTYEDSLRHFYPPRGFLGGKGLKIGIVDTGVGPHEDLSLKGGSNTVVGENAKDYFDNGLGHGTHVAGIIAGQGVPPSGVLGIAPASSIYSFRVFGKNQDAASNYSIAKAIDAAVEMGCDLINMSLGGGPVDEALREAIADARARGVLVIAAAGNDDRSPVSFPASDPAALAVAAMGRKGTFPKNTTQEADIRSPFGNDQEDFSAAFTNIGLEIDFVGPGVGIISTVPGGYAVMDGTSMACPAVTGAAARVLAKKADIISMRRDQSRSDAMANAIMKEARKLGLGPRYEGQGLLR